MYVLVSEHKNCMRIPLKKRRGGGEGGRVQLSQSDYIVILKIFRSSSKTLNIVTGSRVPPGRRRWSVCGGWVGWVGGRQEGGMEEGGRGYHWEPDKYSCYSSNTRLSLACTTSDL